MKYERQVCDIAECENELLGTPYREPDPRKRWSSLHGTFFDQQSMKLIGFECHICPRCWPIVLEKPQLLRDTILLSASREAAEGQRDHENFERFRTKHPELCR